MAGFRHGNDDGMDSRSVSGSFPPEYRLLPENIVGATRRTQFTPPSH
ncbi:MAG: hypothetical protein RIB93_28185 [Coleofasciculus sp. D1-CHI-01]